MAQTRQDQSEDTRIIFLIHIVENDVEFLLLLGQQFERVTGSDRDLFADSRPLEIAAGLLSFLRIPVGIGHAAIFAHRTRPPDGGIADRGPQLKYRSGFGDHRQLVQYAGDRRPDDRDFVPDGLGLHLGQDFVPRRKQGVEIFIDRIARDVMVEPFGACVSWRQTDSSWWIGRVVLPGARNLSGGVEGAAMSCATPPHMANSRSRHARFQRHDFDARYQLLQRARRADEQRKRAEVHGDNSFRLQ